MTTTTTMPQWEITRDVIDGSDTGKQGPRDFRDGVEMPFSFRMRDDDGDVYYLGKCSHRDVFAPLDNFGMPNAGCTSIEYKNDAGVWETL